MRQSAVQECLYVGFFASILYVGGTLPCGRFYYENIDGFFGNAFLRLSYEYLYLYLGLLAHVIDQLERRFLAGATVVQPFLEPALPVEADTEELSVEQLAELEAAEALRVAEEAALAEALANAPRTN